MEKLLTVKEVAEYLQVKPNTVYQWAYKGMLKATRLSAKAMRFTESDIQSFIVDGGLHEQVRRKAD